MLKNDRRKIFRAASDASKIVSFMIGRTEDGTAVVQPTKVVSGECKTFGGSTDWCRRGFSMPIACYWHLLLTLDSVLL